MRSAPFNLLSKRDREQVWPRHIDESLAIAEQLGAAPGERWLDLGTGGGLPGLVLAVVHPEVRFTLLDARDKKIRAVEGFRAAMGLGNVRAVAGRAEEFAHDDGFRAQFDGVVSRALGRLSTVVELSRGFVRPGGVVVAVRGGDGESDLEKLRPVMAQLAVRDADATVLSGVERSTLLVRMRADGWPPRAMPRGNGIPRARPLDAEGS